jgi:hypothetical protein
VQARPRCKRCDISSRRGSDLFSLFVEAVGLAIHKQYPVLQPPSIPPTHWHWGRCQNLVEPQIDSGYDCASIEPNLTERSTLCFDDQILRCLSTQKTAGTKDSVTVSQWDV